MIFMAGHCNGRAAAPRRPDRSRERNPLEENLPHYPWRSNKIVPIGPRRSRAMNPKLVATCALLAAAVAAAISFAFALVSAPESHSRAAEPDASRASSELQARLE